MKRILLFVLSVLMLVCMSFFTLTACGDKGNPNETITDIGSLGGGQVTELSFSASNVNIILGKSGGASLGGAVGGAEGERPVYTSSNPEVASVDANGKVTAIKEGTSTITATYNGKSASYEVRVHLNDMAPTLDFRTVDTENFQVSTGSTANIQPEILFNDEYYTDADFDYDVVDESIVTVDDNGILTPVAKGTTTVTVKGEWRDVSNNQLLQKSFTVNVITDTEILVNGGATAIVELFTVNSHAGVSYATVADFVATAKEGDTPKDVTYAVVEGEDNVIWDADAKTITAVKAGTATMRVSFEASDATIISKDFTVQIKKPVANYGTKLVFSTYLGRFGNVATETIFGYNTTIVEAYQEGTALTVENGMVYGATASAWDGYTTEYLTVYDDKVGYNVTVDAYLAAIYTPEDFVEFFNYNVTDKDITIVNNAIAIEKVPTKKGYVELMANIDLEGYEIRGWYDYNYNGTIKTSYRSSIFHGTFNGAGYTVSNLSFNAKHRYGLFMVTENATIKNVAFVNVKFPTNGGVEQSVLYGTNRITSHVEVSNVYIQVTQLSNSTGVGNAAIAYGGDHDSTYWNNIVVEYPEFYDDQLTSGSGILSNMLRTSFAQSTSNVFVISKSVPLSAHNGYGDGSYAQYYVHLAKQDADKYLDVGTAFTSTSTKRPRRYVWDGVSAKTINASGVTSGQMPVINRFDSYLALYQSGVKINTLDERYWDTSNGIPVFKGVTPGGEAYAVLREGSAVTINAEDTLTLHVDSNIITDDITWESSNPQVATVSNGVVTVLTTGETVISVVMKDKEGVEVLNTTCTVTVQLSNVPKIEVDGLTFVLGEDLGFANVVKGGEWDFDPVLVYGATKYTENDDFDWTYTFSDESLGSIDENGVYTAGQTTGITKVTVSATIYGNVVSYEFNIKVTGAIVFLLDGEPITEFEDITLFNTASFGGQEFVNVADFVVTGTLGGEPIDVEVTIEDQSVATYSKANNTITACNIAGFTATTKVYVKISDGSVAITKIFNVTVNKAVVDSEITTSMFSATEGLFYDKDTDSFLKLETLFDNFAITSAVQGETTLTVTDGAIIGITINDLSGVSNEQIIVYGENGGYKITIGAYTQVIATVEQFTAFAQAPFTSAQLKELLYVASDAVNSSRTKMTRAGSYILVNDITLTKNISTWASYYYSKDPTFVKADGTQLTGTFTWTRQSMTFTGTFDGNGHTVSGLMIGGSSMDDAYDQGGLFGTMVGATIKNIAFTDATVSANRAGAIIGYTMDKDSLISNVYIEVDTLAASPTHKRSSGFMWDLANGTVQNTIVVYPYINETGADQPVGTAAKDVKNWVGVKGYPNETGMDQGGGSLFNYNYDILSGPGAKISNMYVISKTEILGMRYGYGAAYYAENDFAKYYDESTGTWNTDSQGVSYGEYFSVKNGTTIAASNFKGITKIEGVLRYETLEQMGLATGNDYSSFDSAMWDLTSGIPVWKTATATQGGQDYRDVLNTNVKLTLNGQDLVGDVTIGDSGATSSATLGIQIDYEGVELTDVVYSAQNDYVNLDTATGAISYKSGVTLPANEVITVTYKICGKEFSKSINVIVDYAMQNLGEIVFDASTQLLDTSWLGDGETITSVSILGEETNIYSEGKLPFSNDTNAVVNKEVHITTSEKHYKANIAVYTKIIMTAEEYKEWLLKDSYTYTVTHNLTLTATQAAENGGNTAWSETRTGTIDDFKQSNGWYYYELSEQALELLAGGATRKADTFSITQTISGAYALGADIDAITGVPNNGYDNKMLRYVTSANAESTATSGSLDNGSYKLAGANSPFSSSKFEGYFDGMGHSIAGYTDMYSGGLFGTLNGTVKNLAVKNIVLDKNTTGALAFKIGSADAVIENVYLEVTTLVGDNSHRNGVIAGSQSASVKGYTVRNVIIVTPTITYSGSNYTYGVFGTGYADYNKHVNAENLVVLSGTEWLLRHNTVTWKASNDDAIEGTPVEGTFRYADAAAAYAAGVTSVGNWNITKTGEAGSEVYTIAWKK